MMNLIEFIKLQLSKDSSMGDFAKDVQSDNEFPFDKTEEEIISYLDFKTRQGKTNSEFKKFLKSYSIQKNNEIDPLNLDVNFSVLRTESWNFYKKHFPVDTVILVGQDFDFYKVYCIDETNGKALYFDIKSDYSLNDISMCDKNDIYIGNLTKQVSVKEAIDLLQNCNYSQVTKPNEENFYELTEFLQLNND